MPGRLERGHQEPRATAGLRSSIPTRGASSPATTSPAPSSGMGSSSALRSSIGVTDWNLSGCRQRGGLVGRGDGPCAISSTVRALHLAHLIERAPINRELYPLARQFAAAINQPAFALNNVTMRRGVVTGSVLQGMHRLAQRRGDRRGGMADMDHERAAADRA